MTLVQISVLGSLQRIVESCTSKLTHPTLGR